MRVSSTMMVNGYQKQLNNAYENQTRMMEQSDGSKLHRPSDDSVGYSRYLRYRNSMTENVQYQDNVGTAISWMKNTDSAVNDICDCLATVVEKANNAATSTNNEVDMRAIAKEMTAMIQQAVSDANVNVDGHYLISGQSDLIQPYIMSEEKHDRGLAKTLDDGQSSFFNDTGTFNSMQQMLTLEGDDGKTYYVDTKTGDVYSKDFMDSGYKEVVAGGRKTADPAQDSAGNIGPVDVGSNFDTKGVITAAGKTWSQSITVDGNSVALKFATVSQYIVTYNGDNKQISMVKQNGAIQPTADTVNLTGNAMCGGDIFDPDGQSGAAAFNNVLAVAAMTERGENNWISSDGITLANNSYDTVLNSETTLAARQQVYTAVQTMLEKQNVTITSDISKVADTDVAKLAIDLMTMQTIYNMSLSVGGRILPGSLADYL